MGLDAPQYVEYSQTRDLTCVPCTGRRILNAWTTREVLKLNLIELINFFSLLHSPSKGKVKSFSRVRLFVTPWTAAPSMGILQARILERVAMPSSRDGIQGWNPHLLSLLHWYHLRNPDTSALICSRPAIHLLS